MKKHLPTDAISNELAQSSVFFQKPPGARSNEGSTERPNDRTGEQAINPPPEQVNHRTPEVANGRTPERSTLPPPVKSITRSHERPNGRTAKEALPEKTERYSFEIYPSQKERIEEYLYQHKRKTKEKISASRFIRAAIDYYFKTLK
jgi:hypothetical protein